MLFNLKFRFATILTILFIGYLQKWNLILFIIYFKCTRLYTVYSVHILRNWRGKKAHSIKNCMKNWEHIEKKSETKQRSCHYTLVECKWAHGECKICQVKAMFSQSHFVRHNIDVVVNYRWKDGDFKLSSVFWYCCCSCCLNSYALT